MCARHVYKCEYYLVTLAIRATPKLFLYVWEENAIELQDWSFQRIVPLYCGTTLRRVKSCQLSSTVPV